MNYITFDAVLREVGLCAAVTWGKTPLRSELFHGVPVF